MWVNIIFHRITTTPDNIRNDYELTEDQFVERIFATRSFVEGSDGVLRYRFYFDDGDRTFLTLAKNHLRNDEFSSTILGIVTDNMDTEGYLSSKELRELAGQGFIIASHSTNHPALAFYKNGKSLPSTPGGDYQSSSFGHIKVLSEQEVLFQLNQSYTQLKESGLKVVEFVLPHGCHNKQTIQLANQTGLYKTMSTCDPFLDTGTFLRPRLLTRHSESLEDFKNNLNSLRPTPETYGQ